ncbi:MAG: hypothetical protein RL367_52 [Pseudomonadota bacterium]
MLIVTPSGLWSWQVRLQVDGKRRDFGLGSAKDLPLSEARDKADAIRKLYRSGVDPVAQRRAAKRAQTTLPTFREAAITTHGEQVKGWAVESTSFPDAVSETALAHKDTDKVRRAYRRTDFRKMRVDLMAAWASFIGSGGAENSQCVPHRPPLAVTVQG